MVRAGSTESLATRLPSGKSRRACCGVAQASRRVAKRRELRPSANREDRRRPRPARSRPLRPQADAGGQAFLSAHGSASGKDPSGAAGLPQRYVEILLAAQIKGAINGASLARRGRSASGWVSSEKYARRVRHEPAELICNCRFRRSDEADCRRRMPANPSSSRRAGFTLKPTRLLDASHTPPTRARSFLANQHRSRAGRPPRGSASWCAARPPGSSSRWPRSPWCSSPPRRRWRRPFPDVRLHGFGLPSGGAGGSR